jgi:hypothetical protein
MMIFFRPILSERLPNPTSMPAPRTSEMAIRV